MNRGDALERDIVPNDSVSQFQPNDQQHRQYAPSPAHAHARAHAHVTFSPPGADPFSLGLPSPHGSSSFHASQNPTFSVHEAPRLFPQPFPGGAAGGGTTSVGSTRSAPNTTSARHQHQGGIQAPHGAQTTVSGIAHSSNGYASILAGSAETAHPAAGNGVASQGGSVSSYDQAQRSGRNEINASTYGDWQSVPPPPPPPMALGMNTTGTGMMTPCRGLHAPVEPAIDSHFAPSRGGAYIPSSHHQLYQPWGQQDHQSLATPSSSSSLVPPCYEQEQSSHSNSRARQVQSIAFSPSTSINPLSSSPSLMPESSRSSSHGVHNHLPLPHNIHNLLDTLITLLMALAAEGHIMSRMQTGGAQATPLLEGARRCVARLSREIRANIAQLESQLGLAEGVLGVEDTLVALLGNFYVAPSTGTE